MVARQRAGGLGRKLRGAADRVAFAKQGKRAHALGDTSRRGWPPLAGRALAADDVGTVAPHPGGRGLASDLGATVRLARRRPGLARSRARWAAAVLRANSFAP